MYLTTHPGLLVAVVEHYIVRIESFPKAERSFRFMNYNRLRRSPPVLFTARPTVMRSLAFLKPLTSMVVERVRSGCMKVNFVSGTVCACCYKLSINMHNNFVNIQY